MKRTLASIILTSVVLMLTLVPLTVWGYALNDQNKPLSREILTEGMVLLKNENDVLPLQSTDRIAVFGSSCLYTGKTTNGFQIGGGGSSELMPDYTPVDLLSALEEAEKAGEISIYKPLADAYRNDISYIPDEQMYADARAATDKAVMIFSRYSSESSDRKAEKGDWYLSDEETDMLKKLSSLYDKVIVLVNTGGAIDTSWAVGETDGIDVEAVLFTWYPGTEGGNAIADLLLGKVNPSGKLSSTFAADLADYPSNESFDNTDYTAYTEDIYIGYRYFTTFDKKVNYPFGFGLSYTDFSLQNAAYSADENDITVTVTVANIGNVSGKEVVQVYYGAPRLADGGLLGNPKAELVGFAKTRLLAVGESETLSITFPISDMASFDDTGATGAENKSAYVLEEGDYTLYLGNSVTNALENPLGTYSVEQTRKVEQLHEYCAPTDLVTRLRDDGTYETLPTVSSDTATKPDSSNTAVRTVPETVITGRDVLAGNATIDDFLAQMSEKELVSFMVGHDGKVDNCSGAIGGSKAVRNKYLIPEIQTADGPGGLRLGRKATGWGCETLIACTWNPSLAEKMGKGVADEAKISYIDVWLAPGVNLHRHPLCGRNFEYYSEDPFLSGKMAAATVEGAQSNGLYVAIKHFVANEKEDNRNLIDSRISQRALRELYLKPFEICLKQENSPRFVMSSYNYLNGYEASERYDLLNGILRREFGFEGVILTDWYNDSDPVKELRAGINVKMPIGSESKLLTAVQNGVITRSELIEAVKPTVSAIFDSRKIAEISSQTVYAEGVSTIPAENCYRTDGSVYKNDFLMNIGHYDARNNFIPCYLHYFIDVESDGYYLLSFSALNESGKHHSDCVDVFVDGKQCKNISYQNNYLSADYSFAKKECGVVYLPEGEHSLCIKIKNYFGRLDGILFEPTEKPEIDPLTIVTLSYSSERNTIGTLPSSYNGTFGEKVTLPSVSLRRYGYTFEGWTDGDNTYFNGDVLTLTEDVTLQAVWTPDVSDGYTYRFVSVPTYTGSLPEDVQTDKNSLVILSCTAAKVGYTLSGFTDGKRIYKIGDTVTSDGSTVLSAVWAKENSDLERIVLDGTRPDFDNSTLYASGSSTAVLTSDPANTEAYAYYVQAKNGAVYSSFCYRNTQAGFPLKAGHTYDISLEYYVTGINKNGVETTTEAKASAYINIEYSGTPHLIASDSAEIGQWRKITTSHTVDSDFVASQNDLLSVYINPDTDNTAGFNFYITSFSVIDRTSTVTFASRETYSGTLPSSIDVTNNAAFALPTTDIRRDGYSFDGWTNGETTYRPGESFTVTKNTTFYAVWTPSGRILEPKPGDTLTDMMTLSFKPFTVVNNPDNASEKVFYTDYGIYIANTHGLISLEKGHTYKFSIDVRPNEARSFVMFFHKDKSASPETFIYTGIGSASAQTWTTLSTTFTLDSSYNPVSGNTLQIQIQGSNTPYYFRNLTLTDLTPQTRFTVSFESDGSLIGTLPDTQTVKQGDSFVLPNCTAKRPGYVFDGWQIGTTYHLVGDSVVPTADTKVCAVWLKQSVVFALRPEKSYSDVKTFSWNALTVASNPDNTSETVFRTENGIYIENTGGLLNLQAGATYRLTFDIRPDQKIQSLALFCHKDKSASPESFIYQGIGSAEANVWTTLTTEFTLDSYNNISGNTMQIQISGTNTPYYIRNIVLEGVPNYTVSYTDKDGHVTEIVDLYGTTSTSYTPKKELIGSSFYTLTVNGKTQICAADVPIVITEKNTVLTPYFPTRPQILEYVTTDGKATVKLLVKEAGDYTVAFAHFETNRFQNIAFASLSVKEAGIYTVSPTTNIALGTKDRIMLYGKMDKLIPLCEAFTVS